MKLKNVILAIKGQLPLKRLLRNFFITGNAWGMFSKLSHVKADGKLKVQYSTKESAQKAAVSMEKKHGVYFSVYKCVFCDSYHIGRNKYVNDR